MTIHTVHARMIYDCRGYPTIEVELTSDQGTFMSAVPCGLTVGKHETLDLRDKDLWSWAGRGVYKAIGFINTTLGPAICNRPDLDESKQEQMDKVLLEIDGTENKSIMGANSILGVSMAICRAGAAQKSLSLYKHISNLLGTNRHMSVPIPVFDVINSGRHSGCPLPLQEYQIIPKGAKSFAEARLMGTDVFLHLGDSIEQKFGQTSLYKGEEGGYAPNIHDSDECLRMMTTAIEQRRLFGKVFLGFDAAATQMYKNGLYDLQFKQHKSNPHNHMNSDQLMELYRLYVSKYPVISICDPYEQDKWEDWTRLNHALIHNNIQIVGDDLLATNKRRLSTAIHKEACNCVTIKLNQIGSITEALETARLAYDAGLSCVVSDRCGETEDTFIADLAVGIGAGQLKAGAPCRSERVAKYNQVLRIEEEMGAEYSHFGKGSFGIE